LGEETPGTQPGNTPPGTPRVCSWVTTQEKNLGRYKTRFSPGLWEGRVPGFYLGGFVGLPSYSSPPSGPAGSMAAPYVESTFELLLPLLFYEARSDFDLNWPSPRSFHPLPHDNGERQVWVCVQNSDRSWNRSPVYSDHLLCHDASKVNFNVVRYKIRTQDAA